MSEFIIPADTSINGKPAPWTPEIEAKFRAAMSSAPEDDRPVVYANYFTPRPWRDEYDRGSNTEGFTYTKGTFLRGYEVYQVIINRG